MKAHGRGFLFCLWLCASTATAGAQAAPDEYQSLVQKGLREYELGNFNEAKAFFQQAHQLSPNARTLRGLGMASYEIRHYVEAIDYFEKALASTERALTPQMRAEVSQLLGQARSFVTRLTLKLSPEHAQVRIDTREVSRDRENVILLDPGTHELVAEAAEFESVTRSLRCDSGEALSLNIQLKRAGSVDVALAPPDAAPVALNGEPAPVFGEPRTDSSVDASPQIGPYIVIGASAAVAIAGGALLAVALNNKHAVENPEQTGETGPRYADYKSRADSVMPLSAAGIAALSVGVVGGIASAKRGCTQRARPEPRIALSDSHGRWLATAARGERAVQEAPGACPPTAHRRPWL